MIHLKENYTLNNNTPVNGNMTLMRQKLLEVLKLLSSRSFSSACSNGSLL